MANRGGRGRPRGGGGGGHYPVVGRGGRPPNRPYSPAPGRGGGGGGGSPKDATDEPEATSSRDFDPECCGPPRCDPFLPCTKDNRKPKLGTRPDIPARVPCEHVDRSHPGDVKCCRAITLGKYIINLHCAWHHECLRCARCKCTLDDDNVKVLRGLPYCLECAKRLKGNHGDDMRSVHRPGA